MKKILKMRGKFFLTTSQTPCTGYLGYPFQNKLGKSCLENLARDVEKEEKSGVVVIISALK